MLLEEVFICPQLLRDVVFTMAGSRSALSHIFRFVSITLISNPASDQTPLHSLSAGHRALWKSTDSGSLTYRQRTEVKAAQTANRKCQDRWVGW